MSLLLIITFCLWPAWAVTGPTLPRPTGHVSDHANLLPDDVERRTEVLLRELEAQTSAEVAVVTIPSLEGDSLERYTTELFSQWGVGKKGKDNGVMILIAHQERKIRIEVGYGLEATLTDGTCGTIIRQLMVPHFKGGEPATGVWVGAETVAKILRGEPGAVPQPRRGREDSLLFYVLLGLVIVVIVRSRGRSYPFWEYRRRGRFWRGGPWTGGFGGGGFSGGGGFGGFGGGFSGGGGASGGW